MAYAILRTQKLKTAIAVHRSMKHAFRAQETPNADPERLTSNTHIGAHSVQEGMAAFRSRVPEKHRKDAVLAIEYLVTGSPEGMNAKTRDQQDAYLYDALTWLKAKHGAENVVYAGIHRDETTPHMYAYVVPRVGDKLNCRAFLGGAKALTEMQTEFASSVGAKHGLERGLEGSKARHTTISQYYARVSSKTPPALSIDVPEPSLSDRLNPLGYGQKVAHSVLDQLAPTFAVLQAKAQESDLAKKQAKEARASFEDLDQRLKPLVDVLRPLNQEERKTVVNVATLAGKKLEEAQKTRVLQRYRAKVDRGREKGGGRGL